MLHNGLQAVFLDRADLHADTAAEITGHDRAAAARLRSDGWRTVAAIGEHDDPAELGCTHRLDGPEPKTL